MSALKKHLDDVVDAVVDGFQRAGSGVSTKVGHMRVHADDAVNQLKKLDTDLAGKTPTPSTPRVKAPTTPTAKPERIPKRGKYSRPSGYRKGVRDDVWSHAAADSPDGIVRDPLTQRVLNPAEAWDMGHRPSYEFRKAAAYAEAHGWTRKQFLDWHNDPAHYRPELPSSNRSHRDDDISDLFGL